MNQAPTIAQLLNGVHPSIEAQVRIENLASPGPLPLLDSQTPLGELIDQTSAILLPECLLAWHVQYWLSQIEVRVPRSEDQTLSIEIEQKTIPDLDTMKEFCHASTQFRFGTSDRDLINQKLHHDQELREEAGADRKVRDQFQNLMIKVRDFGEDDNLESWEADEILEDLEQERQDDEGSDRSDGSSNHSNYSRFDDEKSDESDEEDSDGDDSDEWETTDDEDSLDEWETIDGERSDEDDTDEWEILWSTIG